MKKYYRFTSANREDKVHVVVWVPKESPKAIVQLSHGMIEHIGRYDDFANYLNLHGYLVVGNDHLGHGYTAGGKDKYGYYGKGDGSKAVTKDLHTITKNIKKLYGDLPVFLIGHSMGSFIARRYAMEYGNELTGAVFMSTGNYSRLSLCVGHTIVESVKFLRGDCHRSEFVNDILFGMYNKEITNPRTVKDWLSSDEVSVDEYLKDDKCNFIFTTNGLKVLLDTLSFIEKQNNIDRIPKDLPILLIAGKEDPVGEYGKAVIDVHEIYRKSNIEDVEIKLYEEARHELLHEKNRMEVYEDVLEWLEYRVPMQN